jgi:hypothetical protein
VALAAAAATAALWAVARALLAAARAARGML